MTSADRALCATALAGCAVQTSLLSPAQRDEVTTVANIDQSPGQPSRLVGTDCAARAGKAVPVVTPGLARAQVVRLLPHPIVGVAPVDHVTLVRIDTLFWVPTNADLDLGTATLLGQPVALRAHLSGVDWTFGDHTPTTHANGPGAAFPSAGPCRTAQCPAYFSHDYEHTGRFDVAATLTWAGQFKVGAGDWQDIAQTVAITSPNAPIHVREARGVLTS